MITGVVTDNEKNPLPGVNVTASGPSLIGVISDTTSSSGAFRLPGLPPGTYTLTAELNGFKTFKREAIIVRVGMVVTINITMEPATIEEEVTVIAPSPTVDTQSLKLSMRIDSEQLGNLPLSRRFGNIVSLTPGVIEVFTEKMTGMSTGIIHGSTAYAQAFEVDGVNVVDPAHRGAILFTPQYDSIEEIEIVTGGLSAEIGGSAGNFINVVTKSGGNDFHGTFNFYYMNKDLAEVLFPDEQLAAMGVGKPVAPIFSYDLSGSLGGPIIRDRLWFFTTLALENSKRYGPFIPTTILGKNYSQYNVPQKFQDVFLKLTTQISPRLRLFSMFGFSEEDLPVANTGARVAIENTFDKSNNRRMTGTLHLNWQMNSNSIIEIRGGFSRFNYPIADRPEQKELSRNIDFGVGYLDGYTGYQWNYPQSWASDIRRLIAQSSARLTYFVDNFLGGNHQLSAGTDFKFGQDYWGLYRPNPLNIDYYKGNIYYFRELYGLNGPHPTYGDGRVMFQIYPPNKDGSVTKPASVGYGAYVQDNFTIKRLTISLGIRLDSITGYIPESHHDSVKSELALAIGDYYIKSLYGFNPFAYNTTPAWKEAMNWTTLTPRFGLSYDLFGNGKTALKASYCVYAEDMPVMYYQGNHPFSQSQWGWNPLRFYWWDSNNSRWPDPPPMDKYQLYSGSVSDYDPNPSTYTQKIDKNVKAPKYYEIIAGIDHELFSDFRLSLKYFYRERKDCVHRVLYDRTSKRFWYTYEQAKDWWVPFTTVVPAYGIYPEQKVTIYFPSLNSPWNNRFYLFTNVPEAKRQYQAFEIIFEKRYSHGWFLSGSIVFSKTQGNYSGRAGITHGFSSAFNSPNWFVNGEGRTDDDRPLAIKLIAGIDIPFGFVMSVYVSHFSGFPFNRTVTVYPPSAWAAANNVVPTAFSVNVEGLGARRNQTTNNVDFRLEKEIKIGQSRRLDFALDIYNLLGHRYTTTGLDPAGTWRPSDANTVNGVYSVGYDYGRTLSITGTRLYKLNISFKF